MHGPSLTHDEIVELLAREVRKLTSVGVPQHRAVAEVARRHGIKQSQLVLLIEQSPEATDEVPQVSNHRACSEKDSV